MGAWRRVLACATGLIALALGASPPAGAAASGPITGRLDRPGYTVIAVAADGRAAATLASSGSFSLVPTSATVSLQLRAPNGTYAGPIVLAVPAGILKHARTALAQAKNKVRHAKTALARAQKQLRQVHGTPAERGAVKRLRQAKAQLKKSEVLLKRATTQLTDVQRLAAPSWAIVGVKAGATLGAIRINPAAGYARAGALSDRVWTTSVKTAWTAQAKHAVPIGNGRNDGLVRSTLRNGAFMGDPDRDGVPDAIDVDINGNRIFNNVDSASAGRSAHAAQAGSETINSLLDLGTGIDGTVNVDAGLSDAQIAAALPNFAWFALDIAPGDSVELDCGGSPDPYSPTGWSGGLSWCAKGGTGRLLEPGGPLDGQPFPACCDSNGNGYGTMINTNPSNSPAGQVMSLSPHAPADLIGTGDTLIERVTTGGVEHQLVMTLQYSVATVDALVSYDDGQGDSATVSYPVSGPGSQPPGPPGPGTQQNPFPVKADPSTGRVTVRVTLWRPQRRPIPPDANGAGGDACLSDSPPCQWVDIGGLGYAAPIEHTGAFCPLSAFVSHGANLDYLPLPFPGVKDLVPDQPANPSNTLTYTLDLTTCAAAPVYSEGRPAPPYSFQPGDTRALSFSYFSGSSGGNGASSVQGDQGVYFTRVS